MKKQKSSDSIIKLIQYCITGHPFPNNNNNDDYNNDNNNDNNNTNKKTNQPDNNNNNPVNNKKLRHKQCKQDSKSSSTYPKFKVGNNASRNFIFLLLGSNPVNKKQSISCFLNVLIKTLCCL